MSDTPDFGFGKFVPGFDFLQNLTQQAMQSAGKGMPPLSGWVAPTLNPEDLDKRIEELKAVQFWLEQNGTALKATIQALEVQRMTLATLRGMNVQMGDVAAAFGARPAAAPAATSPMDAVPPSPFATRAPEPPPASAAPAAEAMPPTAAPAPAGAGAGPAADRPAIDPLQWWGALTQQFQHIAAAALKDAAPPAAARGAGRTAAAGTASAKSARPARKAAAKAAPRASAKKAGAAKTSRAQPKAASKPAPRKPSPRATQAAPGSASGGTGAPPRTR